MKKYLIVLKENNSRDVLTNLFKNSNIIRSYYDNLEDAQRTLNEMGNRKSIFKIFLLEIECKIVL